MQTLGISDSGPRTESRLKSLFWPSVQSGSDVDYLGTQGYWVCAIVAVFSLILFVATGHPIAGSFVFLYYYLGGVGVREHSFYAAVGCLYYVCCRLSSFTGSCQGHFDGVAVFKFTSHMDCIPLVTGLYRGRHANSFERNVGR